MVRANATKEAKVILVIETVATRGLGTEKDPERLVKQYWDLDGNFLAEMDPELTILEIETQCNMIKKSFMQET